MSFIESCKNISTLLSSAEYIDVANNSVSVKNCSDNIVISLHLGDNGISNYTFSTNEQNHFISLKQAIIFSSDFNNASKNGVLKFPFPKNIAELSFYIENRSVILSMLYRKEPDKLITHNKPAIPYANFDDLCEDVSETNKKKNTSGGTDVSATNTMSFDELVASVEQDTNNDKTPVEKSQSQSMER